MAGSSPARRLDAADWVIALAVVAALLAYDLAAARAQTVVIDHASYTVLPFDDIYITMRFARHLSLGHGLVWNVGDAPVEGFTNPLWLLVISALGFVKSDPAPLMVALAAACHAAAVVVLHATLRLRLQCALGVAAAADVLLATWVPLDRQVLAGTEMGLLVLLLLLCLWAASAPSSSPSVAAAAAAGILPLVRPEALVLTLMLALSLSAGRRASARRWAAVALALMAPLAALTLFRLAYFGDLAPNTYYLKVWQRPGRLLYGGPYVRRFIESFYASPLLPLAALWGLRSPRRFVRPLGAGALFILADVAFLGGDAWDQWRLMIPVLPLLLVVLGALSPDAAERRPLAHTVVLYGLLAASQFPLLLQAHGGAVLPGVRVAGVENLRTGLLLRRICRPDATVAHFWAGAAAYYSERRAIDMLGKSNPHIARVRPFRAGAAPGHDGLDTGYVLGLHPDLVVSHHGVGIEAEALDRLLSHGLNPFGAVLLTAPAFARDYAPLDSILSRRWHGLYVRRAGARVDAASVDASERDLLQGPCVWLAFPGFGDLEHDGSSWWRWALRPRAAVAFSLERSATVMIAGKLTSASLPDELEASLDGRLVGRIAVRVAGPVPFAIGPQSLAPGHHELVLKGGAAAASPFADKPPVFFCVRDLELRDADGRALCGP